MCTSDFWRIQIQIITGSSTANLDNLFLLYQTGIITTDALAIDVMFPSEEAHWL